MLSKFFKNSKNHLPIKLFVIAALGNFILVMFALFLFIAASADPAENKNNTDLVYFNKRPESGDPLMTRVPNFKDYIARPIINSSDPILGKSEVPFTIAQFSDFKCPACASNMENIKKLASRYPDRVRFIWKDFPQSDLNSDTWKAALAGRCGADQGKFWEYEKLIFENNSNLSDQALVELAGRAGMDTDEFKKCYGGYVNNKLLIDNLIEAEALGISGVPTVYVNDKALTGELKYEDLEMMIK